MRVWHINDNVQKDPHATDEQKRMAKEWADRLGGRNYDLDKAATTAIKKAEVSAKKAEAASKQASISVKLAKAARKASESARKSVKAALKAAK